MRVAWHAFFQLLLQLKTCNSAHEQAPLSNDTIDSVLRHREVGRAKDLSPPPHTELAGGYEWFYVNEVSILQLIGLHCRVIGMCVDVVCIVDFVESGWQYFLENSIDFNRRNPCGFW